MQIRRVTSLKVKFCDDSKTSTITKYVAIEKAVKAAMKQHPLYLKRYSQVQETNEAIIPEKLRNYQKVFYQVQQF